MNKAKLRDQINKERKQDLFQQAIIDNLRRFLVPFKTIGLYYPLKGEIDILPLIKELMKENKIYLPFCQPQMFFHYLDNLVDLKPDYYKILGPVTGAVDCSIIDVLVIPALAINLEGYRLGYGTGCYDRFLKNYNGQTVGLVYEKYLLDNKFQELHDQPVDYIITEKRIVQVKKDV